MNTAEAAYTHYIFAIRRVLVALLIRDNATANDRSLSASPLSLLCGVGSGECPGEGSESWRWGVPSVRRAVKGEPDGVRLVDYLVLRREEAKEESSSGRLEGKLSDGGLNEKA